MLEVADIFRGHGPAWRDTTHLSLGQLKVMSAIERCRTAALGGHVLRCSGCAKTEVSFNSCRDRHCPKCQASAAHRWLEARQADLLPVEYFHIVFTLPAPISAIAWYNKRVIYGLLFDIAADTLRTIAEDPRHLGARIGATLVLHTWGSALTHHPHVHGIVPGGGLSPDGERWIACGRASSCRCASSHACSDAASSRHSSRFTTVATCSSSASTPGSLIPLPLPGGLRRYVPANGSVYAKRPFAGPKAVLEYLSRYTHRVAISNQRLVAFDERGVTFRWKDYRAKGRTRYKTMTLETGEFMRRFLLHVLPGGFHRIRHYGLLANPVRRANLAKVRDLLHVAPEISPSPDNAIIETRPVFICRHCGAPMIVIEILTRCAPIRAPPMRRDPT